MKMKGTFHAKRWREKLASQSTCSEKFHTYSGSERLYVARLRNITLPFGLGIHDDANQTSGGRMYALILHLNVVVEYSVREHDLELASCEVTSRTGMTPVSERQELWGGGNNIIFLTILLEPHFREAEAIKLFGIFVRFRVVMCLCKIDSDCSSLRNTSAIRECVILPGNSHHYDCFCQRKVYTGWSGTHDFPAESFAATP